MAQDRHVVYAVTRAGRSHARHRVSNPLPWGEAQDYWNRLSPTAGHPGHRVRNQAVRWYCVRAADDPAWPVDAPLRNPEVRA